MLDDLKYMHERDAQDALGANAKQPQQLTYTFNTPSTTWKPQNIVFSAMGGSALAAQATMSWPGYTVPFEIVRSYDIPAYVSDQTLFIAASYSGGTEETLSALEQAEKRGARVMIITGGGKLAEIARQKGYPLALLPSMPTTRYTTLLNIRAILELVRDCQVLAIDDALQQVATKTAFLEQAIASWLPELPVATNPAKQCAQELLGRSVVIYSGPAFAAAAYKWKISINENARQIAWTNQLPEFSHNEFSGWTKQPIDKPYAIIDIRSSLDHPRVTKRFELSERLLSGMRPAPLVVEPQGNDILEQLLWTIVYGDFVGIYLGLLNGINPTPLELVDTLKQALSA
jgi:glucose/mannose-6-phosphate isomerase